MWKKTSKYKDYLGNERTEDFYFNLTEAECLELEMSTAGGLQQQLTTIIAAQDMPTIISTFKKILLMAYGEKSPDGRRFMKTNDQGVPLSKAFSETEAYSMLFMELSTDADKASEFINAIVPEKAKTDTPSASFPMKQ